MPAASLPIIPASLPNGWCPSNWQELLNKFCESIVQIENSGFTIILKDTSAPGASDRDKLWYNENDNRTYEWDNTISAWISRHPIAASSFERRLWVGTPVALQTHDGGDSAAVGDASGPMWQEDTDYQGRVFVGVGTLQPSATAVLLGATGGVDQVKLTSAQSGLPAHVHSINSNGSDSGVAGDVFTKANGSNANAGNTQSNIAADAAEFHTNMPPYRAGYIIKRTARVFYKA